VLRNLMINVVEFRSEEDVDVAVHCHKRQVQLPAELPLALHPASMLTVHPLQRGCKLLLLQVLYGREAGAGCMPGIDAAPAMQLQQ
jgi:hypothetical protein